jgi:putative transposase
MIRAHRIRLNPTPEQTMYFVRASGVRRFTYNWGLAEWIRQCDAGQKPSIAKIKAQFNAIRRELFPWSYDTTKCAVEGAFMDLREAFNRYFESRKDKTKKRVGFPKFKAKKRSKVGFYVANDKFSVDGHTIKLPHIGDVNMTEKLRLEGKILSARITQSGKWWFVSITVETTQKPCKVPTNGAVGMDLGINRLATLSDGAVFENQKYLQKQLKRLKGLQKSLSRKQKGSKNREKARMKLAIQHYHVTCSRDDFLHKLTTELVEKFALIGIESLNVAGMMKNHRLAQALADASFSKLRKFLTSKAEVTGAKVVLVGTFFPSSKRCSQCHHIKADLTLSDRVYECPNCGMVCDRDLNASINILQEVIRLSESSQT